MLNKLCDRRVCFENKEREKGYNLLCKIIVKILMLSPSVAQNISSSTSEVIVYYDCRFTFISRSKEGHGKLTSFFFKKSMFNYLTENWQKE